MRYTTPAPSVDIAAEVPGIAAYTRTAVRLHPRSGQPGASDSHIGGPLWWPADESWPTCSDPHMEYVRTWTDDGQKVMKLTATNPDASNSLVSVAQLWRRDFPEIGFPDDSDVLQVLWCPFGHNQDDMDDGPSMKLVWRRSEPDATLLDTVPAPRQAEDFWIPHPCSLHPERVVEYPFHEVLPPELRERLNRWEISHAATAHPDQGRCSCYQYLLSVAPGCKVGGWTSWHSTDMYSLPCNDCGDSTRALLQLDSTEWDAGSGPRWKPRVQPGVEHPGTEPEREPTALEHGRWGAMTIFTCQTDPRHEPRSALQ
ncbi:hypothetical protein [Nocardia fusca]|uniref:DUF1963 domain-containing protein n=1 Tax=Nocardia fusca TaxID=941183 RepID=A0ABV3F0D9_9NOCA